MMVDQNDVLNRKFEKHRGGYNTVDVDSYMAEVASVITRLRRDDAELKRHYDAACAKIDAYEKERQTVSDALLNAQKLSDRIVREAREKAENIESDARGKADSLISEIRGEITAEQNKLDDMKRSVSDFRSQMMKMYKAHIELINDIPVYRGSENAADAQSEAQQAPAASDEAASATAASGTAKAEEKAAAAEAAATAAATGPQAAAPQMQAATAPEPKHAPEPQPRPIPSPQPEAVPAPVAPAAKPPKAEPLAQPQAAPDEEPYLDLSAALGAEQPEKTKSAAPSDVRLNVRFDEKTGEYVPLAAPAKNKHYDFDTFKK